MAHMYGSIWYRNSSFYICTVVHFPRKGTFAARTFSARLRGNASCRHITPLHLLVHLPNHKSFHDLQNSNGYRRGVVNRNPY